MNPVEKLDELLIRQGFTFAPVRRVARALLVPAFILLVLGPLFLPWTTWPFWFGAGACLSAWNFVSLAFFLQSAFRRAEKGRNISRKILWIQMMGANLRLFITGILVYLFLVIFSANVFALLLGLSLAVLMIPVFVLCFRESPDTTPGER